MFPRKDARLSCSVSCLLALLMPVTLGTPAIAQTAPAKPAAKPVKTAAKGTDKAADKGVPNALQGFSQNRDKPVNIEADSLEVREKDKQAIFSGSVKVVQGDTTLKARSLIVHYEEAAKDGKKPAQNTMPAAQPGPGGSRQISKLQAKGGVIVLQKEQTVTGNEALFDMKTNTVMLTGNVVLTQGQNILRGERLTVDLNSGVSRVEAGSSAGGRVQGLFLPSSADPKKSDSGKPATKAN